MLHKNKKIYIKIIAVFLLLIFGLSPKIIVVAETSQYYEEQIKKLKEETESKNNAISEAQQKQNEYQAILNQKKTEKLTLQNQKDQINTSILETRFKIVEIENLIDKTTLEIQTLGLEVLQNENNIIEQREKIADMIKVIYKNDNRSILEAFLLNDSLSDFLDEIKYTESIQNGLASMLDEYNTKKEELKNKNVELAQKKIDLENQKVTLEDEKDNLINEQQRLALLISQTNDEEKKFQDMMNKAIADQKAMEQEIEDLQKEILDNNIKFADAKRKEDIEKKLLEMGGAVSNNSLSWPVPMNTITTYFHDPDYPFKDVIGEHPAIDIRAKQGTPVKAPAPGYVIKVKDGGATGYSYIMIMHTNDIATVYGHVSKISVSEDQYVSEGDIIGYSGGTPGTHGAGPFTTGPHLHFEVRVSGIPVNPLEYLKIKQ
ncbi:MAG TPA: peptidoglycan DD-metalloendopeptidase family protein [bacterium]|nr:peptidoglycan DD-metalloendopeptidase family protein [bacterium]HPO11036.1 peptidoglycan DD-metalloendopeptidase family protein [bacterium]